MKFEAMFSPVQIGNVTIPNRFAVPPMGNNFADTDGNLSDRSLAYYEARARGGFGLITIESTVVWREAKGGPVSYTHLSPRGSDIPCKRSGFCEGSRPSRRPRPRHLS